MLSLEVAQMPMLQHQAGPALAADHASAAGPAASKIESKKSSYASLSHAKA
jgi:hypothetical protein